MRKYLFILSFLATILFCSPTPAATLYFPHIASDGTFETEICIINPSSNQTRVGDLKSYDNSGNLISSTNIELAPLARREITVGPELIRPNEISYIVFTTNDGELNGYTKFFVLGKYRVAIPAVAKVNTGRIIIPHIASDSNWWTGISLLNTGETDQNLTIDFNNGTSKTVPIKAHEHLAFTIGQLFNHTSQPTITSATIKDGTNLVGLELFGSTSESRKNYLSGVTLKIDTTGSIYYPHVTNSTDWWTGVVSYNPNHESCSIKITPYSCDGTKLTQQNLTLEQDKRVIGTPDTLHLPNNSDWFKIDSDHPITGFELFGTMSGNQLGGYTSVGIDNSMGIFPKLEKHGWTGIAFVNTANQPAAVTITACNDSGRIIESRTLTIRAHGKIVNQAENLFFSDISSATYLRYRASDSIVGFQMNGSDDAMMLDALPALSISSPPPQLLNTTTVNSAGGTIENPDFSLTIPAGICADNTNVSLYRIKDDDITGSKLLSDIFQITNLPEDTPLDLLPKLRSNGINPENPFIVCTEDVSISSSPYTFKAYHLFPATLNTGLITPIRQAQNLTRTRLAENNRTTQLATAPPGVRTFFTLNQREIYITENNKGHFAINYPTTAVTHEQVVRLGQYLEDAYTTYLNMGFSYATRASWPVKINIVKLKNDEYGFFCPSALGHNYTTIQFNQKKMSSNATLRITAGHEFFHQVQSLYDTRLIFERTHDTAYSISLQWLNEACAVWAEEKFTDQIDYVSSIRSGCESYPFAGLQAGCKENIITAREHGYGLSAFIKFLVKRYGESIIREIYLKIMEQKHPVDAIHLATNYQLAMVWELFLRDYVCGNIYHLPPSALSEIISKNFRIRSESDRNKTYTASYPDLSAKLFLIGLEWPDINENASLNIATNQKYCDITAFKFKTHNPIIFLDHVSGKNLLVPNLHKLDENGYNILVMITNPNFNHPYTGTNSKTIKTDFTIIEPGTITLTPDSNQLTADGITSTHITIAARDAEGNPVPDGSTLTLTCSSGTLSQSSVITADGMASVNYTSPTVIGQAQITAVLDQVTGSTKIELVAGPVANLEITSDSTSIAANGYDQALITVSAWDANHNPVAASQLQLSAADGTISATPKTTDNNGAANFTYTAPDIMPDHNDDLIIATAANLVSKQFFIHLHPEIIIDVQPLIGSPGITVTAECFIGDPNWRVNPPYLFDFGGQIQQSPSASCQHTFNTAGTYSISCSVTFVGKDINATSETIEVEVANEIPSINNNFGCQIPDGARKIEMSGLFGPTQRYMLGDTTVGPYITWFDDQKTQLREFYCYAADGTYNGYYGKWYSNGKQLEQGNFFLNQKSGYWVTRRENGTLQTAKLYDAGKLVLIKFYDEEGHFLSSSRP